MRVSCIQSKMYNYQSQPKFKRESIGELKSTLRATKDEIRKKAQDIYQHKFQGASMKEIAEAGDKTLKDSEFLARMGIAEESKTELTELDQFAKRLDRDISIEESSAAIDSSTHLAILNANAKGQSLTSDSVKELYANAEKQKQAEALKIIMGSNPDTAIYL